LEADTSQIRKIKRAVKQNEKTLARLKEILEEINSLHERTAAQLKNGPPFRGKDQ
jgi:hypothetical protein